MVLKQPERMIKFMDKDKLNNKLTTNPDIKPLPHRLEDAPSTDSRHGHGISKDEAIASKD